MPDSAATPHLPPIEALFPFYFCLDADLRFLGAGPSLLKLEPEARAGSGFLGCFEIKSPEGIKDFAGFREKAWSLIVLSHLRTGTLLRGQIFIPADGRSLTFYGSPWLTSAAQIGALGLSVKDFAVHDPVMDVLHLLQAYEQAIQDAKEPNRRMESFFSLSPDLFCIAGFDGRFKLLNPAWSKLLGYTAAEMMSKPFIELVHPDDRAETAAESSKLSKGAATVSFENRYLAKDGFWKHLRWNSIGDVETGLIFASARDISPELEARELSSKIVEASPSGMILVDGQGRIALINAQAEKLFGYGRGELLGRPIEVLVPESLRGAHEAHRGAFARDSSVRLMGRGRDLMGLMKDGRGIPVEIALNPLSIAGAGYVLAAISDITQRKQLEADMLQARDAALELARVKADFLANMSHEIRTPLNAVIGMSGLLLGTDLDDAQRDYARTTRQAGDALLSVISDILDFSKIEAGKLVLEDVEFEPREVIDEAVQLVAPTARGKDLRLTTRVEAGVPALLSGDPGRIRQILLNLLSNAVKFTERGYVRVAVSCDGASLSVTVSDTGGGISAEVLPTLFSAFTQADSSMTRRFGGSGLGLAISRRLVELMGGRISAQSQVAAGSQFLFEIPLRAATSAPPAKPLKGRIVAVAAEDSDEKGFYEEAVSWAGARVCSDPEEADAAVVDIPEAEAERFAARLPKGARLVRVLGHAEKSRFPSVSRPARRSALVDALASDPSSPRASAEPSRSDAAPPARRRILLVEDNSINQKVALAMLRDLGQSADAVGNGLEALEAMSRIQYDLVLMDCQMPEMDGFEAVRRWRQRELNGERVPIVAMTANAMQGDREACLAAGMDDYIAKPVRTERLSEVLRKYPPVVDIGRLEELRRLCREGDPDLLSDLRAGFKRDLDLSMRDLRLALAAADGAKASRAAHKFAGASSSLGMSALCSEVQSLERSAKAGDFAAAAAFLARLEGAASRAVAALERYTL